MICPVRNRCHRLGCNTVRLSFFEPMSLFRELFLCSNSVFACPPVETRQNTAGTRGFQHQDRTHELENKLSASRAGAHSSQHCCGHTTHQAVLSRSKHASPFLCCVFLKPVLGTRTGKVFAAWQVGVLFFFQSKINLDKRKTLQHHCPLGRSLHRRKGRRVPKELFKHILESFLESIHFNGLVVTLKLGKSQILYLEPGFQRANNPAVLTKAGLTSPVFVGSAAVQHM